MAVGGGAVLLERVLLLHLNHSLIALVLLAYLMLITGCLHEDGLADAADGFGGGWSKEQILSILKDSRIGSYGAAALVMSLLARYLLLASLPLEHFAAYVISAHVLCRWSTLPLSYFLPPAREAGGPGCAYCKTDVPGYVDIWIGVQLCRGCLCLAVARGRTSNRCGSYCGVERMVLLEEN